MARESSSYFRSTIGRKTLMGITGLGLCLFVLIHMAENLLLFVSPEVYNQYTHMLVNNPVLPLAEIGLLVFFAGHVVFALWLTVSNQRAKPQGYAVKPSRDRDTNLAAKTLIYSGMLILVFLVLHLIHFKYGAYYATSYNGTEMRDLYKLVAELFARPGYVAWYVFSMIVLGFHLSHAVSASFQTLGFSSAGTPWLRKLSVGFALVVCGGFIVEAVGTFLKG